MLILVLVDILRNLERKITVRTDSYECNITDQEVNLL